MRLILVPKLRVIKKYLNKYFNKGFIRPNTLLVAAPILLVRKPRGGIRIYVNYYKLNNIIVKNKYLILLIRETLNLLSRVKYYTKLNITTAFNQLRIVPGNE